MIYKLITVSFVMFILILFISRWALPDQMAQAGFYHQPNASGDDRAMCFTCTVCLVSWERTDEPWSEHERHSPSCPFVMGEYTQNVPLSVTYATNPAVDATYRGVPINVIGTSSVSNLLPTANKEGLISVFDITGKIKRTHSFFVTQYDSHILEKFTQDFGVAGLWTDTDEIKYPPVKKVTSVAIVGEKQITKNSTSNSSTLPSPSRPTIICGLNIRCQTSFKSTISPSSVETLNDQNIKDLNSINIMEIDQTVEHSTENSCLYLVTYDFLYRKEPEGENDSTSQEVVDSKNSDKNNDSSKKWNFPILSSLNENDNFIDIAQNEISFMQNVKPFKDYPFYQNLIPGESDEIFIPPQVNSIKQHSGPRALPVELQNSETDSAQASSLIIPPNYSFMNGQIGNNLLDQVPNDKSISDHIADLKSSKSNKKLNYSRAVQCLSLPDRYKFRRDLEISDLLPTQDSNYILVVLKSVSENKNSILLLYSLCFSDKMVRLNEEPLLIRELSLSERPIEINLLAQLERTTDSSPKLGVDGLVILVCIDGAVRIIELSTLKTVSIAKLEHENFISAAYCNSEYSFSFFIIEFKLSF